MTVPMPAAAGGRAQQLMSIGEVLSLLRADFPDTTISKLRFLETEGLVEPQRTPSGYRKYSRDDVVRLRFILTAQRDHYLPLRVIREQLDEGRHHAGQRPTLVSVSTEYDDEPRQSEPHQSFREPVPRDHVAREQGLADHDLMEVRLRRDELCERAGISDELLKDLERHGLVAPRVGQWYDIDAFAVAEIAGQLAAYGLEPRHLRAYRVAADREVGLFAQLVTPLARQNDPTARARAVETLRELTVLSQRLHAALLRSGLRDELGQ